jgi:hypothetical protein
MSLLYNLIFLFENPNLNPDLYFFQIWSVPRSDHDRRVGSRHRRPTGLAGHQLRPAKQQRTLHPQNRTIR